MKNPERKVDFLEARITRFVSENSLTVIYLKIFGAIIGATMIIDYLIKPSFQSCT